MVTQRCALKAAIRPRQTPGHRSARAAARRCTIAGPSSGGRPIRRDDAPEYAGDSGNCLTTSEMRAMQITDILAQMGGLQSMARELGVSEDQAAHGAAALAPAILGGFKKQAQAQPAGLEGLGGLLDQLGGGSLLDNVLAPQPTDVGRGDDVLGQIFGSKDVSRTVAQDAAAQSGLPPDLLKKMLPMLAMLVTGFMAKQGGGGAMPQAAPPGGGLGDLLGGLLGGQAPGAMRPGGAPPGMAPGLASMLDMNGDGNPLDDIMRLAGKVLR
jgi:hypothetical protein